MDREEEYFNVKEKCASWADDKSIPARMYFSNVFGVAYRLGKKHAQDEQDEEMLSVPKEKVQELYDNAIKAAEAYRNSKTSGYSYYQGQLYLLDALFGSKLSNVGKDWKEETPSVPQGTPKPFALRSGERIRLRVATAAMQGLLNATSVERFTLRIKPSSIAETAVEYADALITEVSKKGGCDE